MRLSYALSILFISAMTLGPMGNFVVAQSKEDALENFEKTPHDDLIENLQDSLLLTLGSHEEIIQRDAQSIIDNLGDSLGLEVIRKHMLIEITHLRDSIGVQPISFHSLLNQSAQNSADTLAKYDWFGHRFGGTSSRDRISAVGYRGASAENFSDGRPTIKEAVAGWFRSDFHRQIMLSPNFNALGIGYSQQKYKKKRVTHFGNH